MVPGLVTRLDKLPGLSANSIRIFCAPPISARRRSSIPVTAPKVTTSTA